MLRCCDFHQGLQYWLSLQRAGRAYSRSQSTPSSLPAKECGEGREAGGETQRHSGRGRDIGTAEGGRGRAKESTNIDVIDIRECGTEATRQVALQTMNMQAVYKQQQSYITFSKEALHLISHVPLVI